jgi:hypothetical protein
MSEVEIRDSLRGKCISKIFRIFYNYQGEIDEEAGALEFQFHNSSTVLLDSGSDGEALFWSSTPWADPFSGPLSEENQQFIAEHGRWHRFDVSERVEYRDIVGKEINDVELLRSDFGKIVGVVLRSAGKNILRAEVIADEFYVSFPK